MKILVDADACPVKNIIEDLAQQYNIEVIMISNHHHVLKSSYAKVLTVDAYSQSVDIAIANLAVKGDIVVTQDYGLAALVLEKGIGAIHPSGIIYTRDNIDGLLMQRFINQKAREARVKTGRNKKRNIKDDIRFEQVMVQLIEMMLGIR
ncbi:MAG: YaiI/YqxD family protein [Syntrophomonadaceae bacterium]|jgi:uncharacterized protein YaiI (UPF0178 family)|nr:YaiI/YqxD family protein [Syntrophomonadaceae bacterium]